MSMTTNKMADVRFGDVIVGQIVSGIAIICQLFADGVSLFFAFFSAIPTKIEARSTESVIFDYRRGS